MSFAVAGSPKWLIWALACFFWIAPISRDQFVLPLYHIFIPDKSSITLVFLHFAVFRGLFVVAALLLLDYGLNCALLLVNSCVVEPIAFKEDRAITVESAQAVPQIVFEVPLVVEFILVILFPFATLLIVLKLTSVDSSV